MTKPLTNSDLDHLPDFIGYGRLDADVWFLGMEEAGGTELMPIPKPEVKRWDYEELIPQMRKTGRLP